MPETFVNPRELLWAYTSACKTATEATARIKELEPRVIKLLKSVPEGISHCEMVYRFNGAGISHYPAPKDSYGLSFPAQLEADDEPTSSTVGDPADDDEFLHNIDRDFRAVSAAG